MKAYLRKKNTYAFIVAYAVWQPLPSVPATNQKLGRKFARTLSQDVDTPAKNRAHGYIGLINIVASPLEFKSFIFPPTLMLNSNTSGNTSNTSVIWEEHNRYTASSLLLLRNFIVAHTRYIKLVQ